MPAANRLILPLLTLVALLILATSLVEGPASEMIFATTAVAFPPLLMLIGAGLRANRWRPAGWIILSLLVLLEACLVGMLALRGTVATGGWILGLPTVTSIQVYGLLLLPLALVAVGFAWTFGDFGVSDENIEQLRRLGRRGNDS